MTLHETVGAPPLREGDAVELLSRRPGRLGRLKPGTVGRVIELWNDGMVSVLWRGGYRTPLILHPRHLRRVGGAPPS